MGSCSSSAASLSRVCQPPESLRDRPFEVGVFQLELPGHLAAFPVRTAAVAQEEIQRGFAGQKRIVLPQVAQPQFRVADHFAAVEFLFAQEHAEQRRLARSVAAHETHLDVVNQRRLGPVQQHLVPVALVSILDLNQHRHICCLAIP